MVDSKTEKTAADAPCFTKAQLLASEKYAGRKDLISTLLAEDKKYTADEADKWIEAYLKGKVK